MLLFVSKRKERVIRMNTSKKLKLAMVLAIFSMMIVPMTVFAWSECDSLQYIIQKRQKSVTESTQLYFYGTIECEDGTDEYVYQDCIITTTIDTYERKCENCGKTFPQQGVGEKKAHSHGNFERN